MWLRCAYLIEGLRLESDLRFDGGLIRPIPTEHGYFGKDGLGALNHAMEEAGFVTVIQRWSWAVQIAPRHSYSLLTMEPIDVGGEATGALAMQHVAGRIADVLSLTHGGAPRVIAGVSERGDNQSGPWQTDMIQVGSGPWPGSTLRKLAQDDAGALELDFAHIWRAGPADPRVPLWLSLHRDNVTEPRWDARIFRTCSLLEAIASEVLPSEGVDLHGPDGEPLRGHDGKPATTRQTRGAIYLLVRVGLNALSIDETILLAHPDRKLWDEVGVWWDVRNSVGHEGRWTPSAPPAAKPSRRARAADAFRIAARGNSLESGWLRYADTSLAAAEVVLRAATSGAMFDEPAGSDADEQM